MTDMSNRTARKSAKLAEIRKWIKELQDSLRYAMTYGDTEWEAELRVSLANAEEELNGWLDS